MGMVNDGWSEEEKLSFRLSIGVKMNGHKISHTAIMKELNGLVCLIVWPCILKAAVFSVRCMGSSRLRTS